MKKEEKSVLLEEPKQTNEVPDYNDDEKRYISGLQTRLQDAQTIRDQAHDEYDGLSFIEAWHANERGANTNIEAVKNKGESTFQSGTLRTKMMAFLSTYQGLNFKSDITAYDENEILINSLGQAMEDIIEKCGQVENDEEWRMIRQYEMLKHGYVFVEDLWKEKWTTRKKIIKGELGEYSNVKIQTKKEKEPGYPCRTIIPGTAVYLGDLRQYMIENQPYLFTVEILSYDQAKEIYGGFERWQYVSQEKKSFNGSTEQGMLQNAWRLLSISGKGQCEIIKYQDKPNNEFQIIINGVPMLPIGYPLTEVSPDGEYLLVQQNLEPIRHNFAYGKSFIFRNKNIVAVLDQMMKLAVLKTQKSFLPPYLNLSGRVISRDIFLPGKMSMGVKPQDIAPISQEEVKGVSMSEFNMIQEVKRFIDSNTVSPTFTGQKEEGGNVTATQIVQLQRQAQIMMGTMNLAAALLEKKLDSKRLGIILKFWFDPLDQEVDKARNVLINKYRVASIQKNIDGGMGMSIIAGTEKMPMPQEIRFAEDGMTKAMGKPVKITLINSQQIKDWKGIWMVTVNPKDKKSSELSKVLFETMVVGARNLGLQINPDYLAERYAIIWEEDPAKMFMRGQQVPQQEQPMSPEQKPTAMPKISIPMKK